MKYIFNEPAPVVVEFRHNERYREPLKVKRALSVKTGNVIVIRFIANDGKERSHKYYHTIIKKISIEGRVLYDHYKRMA